jgi:hypothetical protein
MDRSLAHRVSAAAVGMALAACTPTAKPVQEIVSDLDTYVGEKVVVTTKLRSGARCRVDAGGEFKAYCRDCQYCKGPLVVDTGRALPTDVADWPLVLGGTHGGQPIRCEGPLNEVRCRPFDLDRTYVIRGSIEATAPPKLLVSDFWEAR